MALPVLGLLVLLLRVNRYGKIPPMNDDQLLERISIDPKVMLGKPVVKGTRLTVEYVLDRLAQGASASDLVLEYKGLTAEDVVACLVFAKKVVTKTDHLSQLTGGS